MRKRNIRRSQLCNLEPLEVRLLLAADFGDAPAPYPLDAEHTATGPRLGAFRDMEASGIPSLLADSDGTDEDGVAFGLMRIGQQATISVNTQNHSDDVWLNAWVDFNGDGNWGGAGEQILDSYRKAPGDKEIFFDVPSSSASGATYARVRVSTTSQLGHGGNAADGEVEDYVVDIQPAFGAGHFPLEAQRILPGGADGAFIVAAADIDGDGHQDLISGSLNDDTIRWYENDNGHGLNTDRPIAFEMDGVRSVFPADINGDGRMDVVAGSANDDTITWHRQRVFNGSRFWEKETIFTGADSVREVTAADMDGDGDMDILSASAGDDMIRWYRNDGSSGFTVQNITQTCVFPVSCTQITPTRIDGARAVAAADMDGDGDMDVVAAAQHDDLIIWYERRGPNFWAKHAVDTSADGASSVTIADLDGDGNIDIASASQSDNTVAWYENNGAGGFAKHIVSAFLPSAIDVIAADMDGDGDMDLVSGRNEGASVAVFHNDGGGNFERHDIAVASTFDNARPITVAAADFNGDGALDIATAEFGMNRFAIYPKRIEIDLENADMTIRGIGANDYSGYSVDGAGDVNGDGFDDLLIGAVGADPAGRIGAGETYVVFGSASPASTVDLSSLGNAGIKINGRDHFDRSGGSVSSAGDVNGDGFDDLVIGATNAGTESEGESYVIFGGAAPASTMNVSDISSGQLAGINIVGIGMFDQTGTSVSSAGDVNGDGFGDLLIGASLADPDGRDKAGESYVIFGRDDLAPVLHLSEIESGIVDGIKINGIVPGDESGHSVSSAGDVNGDGFDDLLIGAPFATRHGLSKAGESYVVFGGPNLATTLELHDIGTPKVKGIVVGTLSADQSGISVDSAGDVNGDGFDDLLIGASRAQMQAGETYLVFGSMNPVSNLDPVLLSILERGFLIRGIDEFGGAGQSVSGAGDVNGDGFDDLLIGSPGTDTDGSLSGESHIIFGGFTHDVFLGGLGTLRISGADAVGIGRAVGGAGDVDGDGYDDIFIGAPLKDVDGRVEAGESYLVFGRDYTNDVTINGTELDDTLNGKAYSDVIIGGRGNDTLIASGGGNVLRGGQGDDVVSIDGYDFHKIVGGNGIDTLRIDGFPLFELAIVLRGRVSGIERIDMVDGTVNRLELTRLEVVNASDESNTLLIDREPDDVIDMGVGWSESGTEVVNGQTYNVWTQGAARLLFQGTPLNSPPMVSDTTFEVPEDTANGTVVATVPATDPDPGDSLNFDVVGGTGEGIFDVNPRNDQITLVDASQLDFEGTTPQSFTLEVIVLDDYGNLREAVITLVVTNANERPEIGEFAFRVFDTDSNGTFVGTVSSTDPDAGDTATYEILSGNPGGAFALNSNSGQLTVANSSLLGNQAQWQLTVRATDTGNLSATGTVTVVVAEGNKPPVLDDVVFAIPENLATGSAIGGILGNDPDGGDTLTYAIIGGNTNHAFNLEFERLVVADGAQLDFETIPTYQLIVRVTDSLGLTDDATVTIHLTDVPEGMVGDINGDGRQDGHDLDELIREIVNGSPSEETDLNGDGTLDRADLAHWLAIAGAANLTSGRPYPFGDGNLDGQVNSSDLNDLALNWRQSVASWGEGDFNADGQVDSADLNELALNWQVDANEETGFRRIPRAALAIKMAATARPADRLVTDEPELDDSANTLPPESGPLDHRLNRKRLALNERRTLRPRHAKTARFAQQPLADDVFESALDVAIRDWN